MQNKTPVTQAEKNQQKLKEKREVQLNKKESQLNKLSDEEVLTELKDKGLPTFGTKQEKLDRLKKYYGNVCVLSGNNVKGSVDFGDKVETEPNIAKKDDPSKKGLPKSNVVDEIEKMKQRREERRLKMEEAKREKVDREAENLANGRMGDVEFDIMIDKHRFKQPLLQPHTLASQLRLCVCVRKRPIFKKEEVAGEIDAVSCANPQIVVHEPKYKVDGITKFVENTNFTFDNSFNESETSDDIYKYSIGPHVEFILNKGIVTCFAYGQTGSGKTFTMKGIQSLVIQDLFKMATTKYKSLGLKFVLSFFEIYGGRCYDLLNKQNKLAVLEDKNQNVQIQGLEERAVGSVEEMNALIEYGNSERTTHQTVANDTSSRSHAICQIAVKDSNDKSHGKLLLVDLAGSERAQDTQSNNRARRIEGAEINKSLLALKECVRAMDSNKQGGANHVPFRASKLTLVLRDSFTSKNDNTRIVMIACISPGSSSADHSLNTLRYADRLKDRSNAPPIKPMKYNAPDEVDYQEEAKDLEVRPVKNIEPNPSKNNMKAPPIVEEKTEPRKPPIKQPQPTKQDINGSKENANANIKKPVVKDLNAGKKNNKNSRNGSLDNVDEPEENGDESPVNIKKANADLKYMKETMKQDNKNKMSAEYFDFQEKVNFILEEQEEIFSTHMSAIKEDARLLTHESELISNVQGVGVVDYDIDSYVEKLEAIIKTKLQIYSILDKKLGKFKTHLKEEEEASSKIKETFYY